MNCLICVYCGMRPLVDGNGQARRVVDRGTKTKIYGSLDRRTPNLVCEVEYSGMMDFVEYCNDMAKSAAYRK